MTSPSADQLHELLARHLPLIRYDSLEPYACDSAAEWTDNPGNVLRRADGSVIAAASPAPGQPQLSLAFLGAERYADGSPVAATDLIADPGHDYVLQAHALHATPGYGNRVYGHWATGSDGRVWLAYWFWYFYNDYNLVGSLLPAGLHEGDWEMIQLRLDPAGAVPDLAVYAEHRHAAARDWDQVERVADQPVVYSARGSHASYFAPGLHWTGHWWDHADGRRTAPAMELAIIDETDPTWAWALWPGLWGGTQPKPGLGDDLGFDDASPRGPGGHAQWRDPVKLLDTVTDPPVPAAHEAPAVPAAPGIAVSRDGANLRINYSTSDPAMRAIVVGVDESDNASPPMTYHLIVSTPQGTAQVPAGLASSSAYVISAASATADGRASASTHADLPSAA